MSKSEETKTMSISAKLIAILAPFMATSDIRYYLNGINVRPHPSGGAVLAATNGHVLGAIHDLNAICEVEVILSLDKATIAACAATCGGAEERKLEIIDGRLTVIDESGNQAFIQARQGLIDYDKYPMYEKVIPRLESLRPGLMGAVNVEYLALMNKVSKAASRAFKLKYTPIRFFNVDDSGTTSAVARLPSLPSFVAVIMPMREEGSIAAAPAWLSVVHEQIEAQKIIA